MIGIIAAVRRHLPALAFGAMVAMAAFPLPAPAAEPPVAISTPPPDFPDGARRAHKSGFVVAAYTVGVDGRVGNVRILESSPRGVFDHAVKSALARWRFEPPSSPREVTHTFYFDE